MTIGEKIKQARIAKGMTQEELAEKLGYKSRSSINKIETGGRDVPRSQLKKIAEILDVSPISLLGLDEEIVNYKPYKMPIIEETTVIDEANKYKMIPTGKHKPLPQPKPNSKGMKVAEVRSINKSGGPLDAVSSTHVSRTPSGLLLDRRVSKYEMAARSLLPRLNDEGLKKVIEYIDDLAVQEKYTKKG